MISRKILSTKFQYQFKIPETELMNQMQTENLKQQGAMTNKSEPRFGNLVLLHAFKIPSYFFRYISGAKRTALTVLRVDFNRWPIAFCIVSTYKNILYTQMTQHNFLQNPPATYKSIFLSFLGCCDGLCRSINSIWNTICNIG